MHCIITLQERRRYSFGQKLRVLCVHVSILYAHSETAGLEWPWRQNISPFHLYGPASNSCKAWLPACTRSFHNPPWRMVACFCNWETREKCYVIRVGYLVVFVKNKDIVIFSKLSYTDGMFILKLKTWVPAVSTVPERERILVLMVVCFHHYLLRGYC